MKKDTDYHKTIRGYFDLDYVILVDVPARKSRFGDVIDLEPEYLEQRIAEEIVIQRVPLRGREIAFLRKVLHLTYEKFGNSVGYTGSGVFKWEKDPDRRLEPINEVAMRIFFAEKLGVELKGIFSQLTGVESAFAGIEVRSTRPPISKPVAVRWRAAGKKR